MADSKSTVRNLRGDQRGAIMVIAVFMSAFLVSGLWYMAGMGNAALFKEGMQSGADAGAFAGAVFHAKGMNLIALLNIIMAALMAVLIALKIALMLLTITYYVTMALCPWTGAACAVYPPAGIAKNALSKFIDGVAEPGINAALTGLSAAQKAVAVGMPLWAIKKTDDMARFYSQPVDHGLMVSEAVNPMGKKLGLPVEDDKFSKLCDKGAEVIGTLIEKIFKPIPTSWISGMIEGLVKAAPTTFCGSCASDGGGGTGTDAYTPEAIAKQNCDAQKKAIEENNKDKKKKKGKYNEKECLKEQTENLKKDSGLSKSKSSGSTGSKCSEKTPKKVFEEAENGNKYFQVMTFSWGKLKFAKKGSAQVKVASWGKKGNSLPDIDMGVWGKVHLGQAEFYYDRAGSWDKLKEEAMWNMRWRARLRHYHKEIAPASMLVNTAIDLLGLAGDVKGAIDQFNDFQNNVLTGGGGLFGGGGAVSDLYTKQAKGKGSSSGGGEFQKVDTGKAFNGRVEH